jgi:hypothetical protein
LKQAEEEGWQRCFNCHAMVERKEGCNHMTCRCQAEFCIVCAKEWKTCDCPWFNNDYPGPPRGPVPDILGGWNLPDIVYRQVFRAAAEALPPMPPMHGRLREQATAGGANGDIPPPPIGLQPEPDPRREQERADAELARRLQFAGIWDDPPPRRPLRGGGAGLGFGNQAPHFLNEDFIQNATDVVINALGDPNMGRRGERTSGRRRRPRLGDQNRGEPGLAPNFLGDESVLGTGPGRRSTR